ncbi:hypothetical protein ISS22_13290 [candidate division KSB1 bacterium]|nr:hypothetical protein [candidate division KSB1 bacterium]
MKKLTIMLVAILMLTFAVSAIYAKTDENSKKKSSVTEANVWTTEDGAKNFKCPVMGAEGVVNSKTTYSIVDGKKYYHCCGGCSVKFTANTAKYLDGFVVPANVVKTDKDGKHYQCAVSGETGVVGKETLFSDKDGKRYYFCCDGCKKEFDKDSGKFIKSDKKAKKM